MAKRFTDTEKWKDPWFRKLSPAHKAMWEFLRDNVDHAGFWKVDLEYMQFHVDVCNCPNSYPEKKALLAAFNDGKERVKDHGDHWELVDFISFQYGRLREEVKPHRPIIDLLKKYGLKGYRNGIDTVEEQEKEMDKEIKGVVRGKPTAEEVKALFREKGFPAEAEKFFDYYEANGWRVGKNPMKNWHAAAANWLRNGKSF